MKNRLMVFLYVLTFFIAVILAGCGGMTKSMAPTPVRDIIFSNELPPMGYGAYGYLIFTKRPDENNMRRYLAACNSFQRNLEPISHYTPSVSTFLMPTYWLIDVSTGFNKRYSDCTMWVKSYDFARAKVIASAISSLNKKGPILVAWSQPFEKVSTGENALILDLSDFSEEDMDRAFSIWMDKITKDPKVWHKGLNLVLAKEAFRSFLETYGEGILKAISTVKEILG